MWLVFAVCVVALASLGWCCGWFLVVLCGWCWGAVWVVLGWCWGGGWCRLCRLVSCVVSVVGVCLWGVCGNLPHPPHYIQSMTYYRLSVAIV